MDLKKVFVIIDLNSFTKEQVIEDLKEEGYRYDFFFGNLKDAHMTKDLIQSCEEVWCFGECEKTIDYLIARELGSDIWQMS